MVANQRFDNLPTLSGKYFKLYLKIISKATTISIKALKMEINDYYKYLFIELFDEGKANI
jgi:hypothetical protein